MNEAESDSITLAQSIAAAMQLRLPGTAGRVARKMRYIDEVAPKFRAGGLVRDVPELAFERLWAVGIASASNHIPAFGGVLYGAAALRQDVTLVERKASPNYQDSQVDVADMTFVQVDNRLQWREYRLTYQLLEELFDGTTLPDLILLDLPLLVFRGVQAASIGDDDVREEWEDLLALLSRFWGRYAARCYPSNPNGPLVAHLGRQHFGAVLTAIQAEGAKGAVDPVTPELAGLIAGEWDELRRAGVNRVLKGLLRPGKRTAAYPYTALGRDALRAAPKVLGEAGLLGFHMQVGYRTPVWQVETVGPADRWTPDALDRLAAMLRHLTLHDHPKALPLPLWYATRLARVPDKLLYNYRGAMTQMLREQAVDRAWLEGVDELASTGEPELVNADAT
jgi:hypothetical protein